MNQSSEKWYETADNRPRRAYTPQIIARTNPRSSLHQPNRQALSTHLNLTVKAEIEELNTCFVIRMEGERRKPN